MSNLGLGQCQADNINQMKTLIMIKLRGLGSGFTQGEVAVMKPERPSRVFTIHCSILKSSLFFFVINSAR